MSELHVIPELKQIIGALLFAAREPVAVETIRKALRDAARQHEGPVKDFEKATPADIAAALEELNNDLTRHHVGIHIGEVANGYRLQNDLNCGIWIRTMLEKGRSNRLSKPALETLAIIAYRQPCTRQEIEAVRGVQVDAILKNLMEMQLVKAAGRSELPGRPWLFATTQKFLEYFGLKNVEDLPGIDELRRMERAQAEAKRNEAIERAVKEEQVDDTASSAPDATNEEQMELTDLTNPAVQPVADADDVIEQGGEADASGGDEAEDATDPLGDVDDDAEDEFDEDDAEDEDEDDDEWDEDDEVEEEDEEDEDENER